MKPDEMEIIEKIRKEKDIFKKAKAIQFLTHEKEIPLVKISELLHEQSSHLSNILRLLTLPDLVRDSYYSKILSLTHLLILSRLSGEAVIVAYEEILSNNLTVQQTEKIVREKLYDVRTQGDKISLSTQEKLIEELKEIDPSINVSIIQTQIQGKLTLTLKGNRKMTKEFFERLQEKLQ